MNYLVTFFYLFALFGIGLFIYRRLFCGHSVSVLEYIWTLLLAFIIIFAVSLFMAIFLIKY